VAIIVWMLAKEFEKLNGIDWEIIVIDDNSPDGTQEIVTDLGRIWGPTKLILKTRPRKLGLGSAYQFGLNFATGDFILILDADLSHHPKYLHDFVQMQRKFDFDIVCGTRYGGSRKFTRGGVAGWDLRRKFVSKGANFIASCSLNPGVSDLTGSFRLYRKSTLENVIGTCVSKGYVFQMEILVRCLSQLFTIGEVPIVFIDRIYGQSKLGGQEIIQYLKGVANLLFCA